jgi:hypothetical protein
MDMLITEVHGRGDIYSWVRRLLSQRYSAVAHHFPVHNSIIVSPSLCIYQLFLAVSVVGNTGMGTSL